MQDDALLGTCNVIGRLQLSVHQGHNALVGGLVPALLVPSTYHLQYRQAIGAGDEYTVKNEFL